LDKKVLDQQSQYWEKNFLSKPEMFGLEPSKAAVSALKILKEQNIKKIIELGSGLGRDTLFFAKNSIRIEALDYSPSAIKLINTKAKEKKLSNNISAQVFDVRKKLPFKNESIEACFSHMLYCMALSTSDLKKLNKEILRILKPGGINIFTVRNIYDGDYKNGIHRYEELYENNGFIVHFFSKEKIEQISKGFKILELEKFEEGTFPRKLYRVTLKKQ
tara:strand:+ start:142 stop:795 length:654 start_codon:yes stop_codon:yes gene_type:complete